MPELIVKLGENIVHKYFFDKDVLSVGRARDNDIVIENLSVSRNHARIRQVDDKFILTDLNSANGTYVNNVRINKTELEHEDIITIGKHKIHFLNKVLSDEQIISDAFGAERTMIVDKTPMAHLSVSKGKQQGQDYKITKIETFIGRSSDNDIRLHDWFVSKKHAMILRQGQNFFIKDLKSWRGTMVNGKFTKEAQLKDGDNLQFGSTIITFHTAGEEEPLKIASRVPKELVEEDIRAPVPEMSETSEKEAEEAPVAAPVEEAMSFEEQLKAEEKEVADMQAAWESIAEEEMVPSEEEEIIPLEEEFLPAEELVGAEIQTSVEEEEEEFHQPPGPGTAVESEVLENLPEGVDPNEAKIWLRALHNPSRVIRKNAAAFLKKITGKDYDYK